MHMSRLCRIRKPCNTTNREVGMAWGLCITGHAMCVRMCVCAWVHRLSHASA